MRQSPAFSLALAAILVLCCGCLVTTNIGSTRVDGHYAAWTGGDLARAPTGDALGIEVALGTDLDPAFGPLYMGVAYSQSTLRDPGSQGIAEHCLGTRWRSSMLEGNTSSYPFAAVGVYLGWMESDALSYDRFGIGVEGGYGFRLGLGAHAALDLEMMMSAALHVGGIEATSTRFGGALVVRY